MRYAATLVTLFVSMVGATAQAIVVTNTSQYIQRPTNALVGRLGGGSCVPIGARYALTANHVGVSNSAKIVLNGIYYPVLRTFSHPNAPTIDMKIVEIKGPPFFEDWVPLHPAPTSVPIHSTVYIGGTGFDTGEPSGTCIAWGVRAEHWATNQVEGYLTATVPYAWYRFDREVPHEGMATLYDSGSPMFAIDPDGCRLYLMGIATSASTASGPTCDGHTAYYLLVTDPWLQQFTGAVCAGDLDRDGDTDLADFGILLDEINGASVGCGSRLLGDLNDDGRISVADFGILSTDFGCQP